MERFFCNFSGSNSGPYTIAEMYAYLQSGEMPEDTFVHQPATDEWIAIRTFLNQNQQPMDAEVVEVPEAPAPDPVINPPIEESRSTPIKLPPMESDNAASVPGFIQPEGANPNPNESMPNDPAGQNPMGQVQGFPPGWVQTPNGPMPMGGQTAMPQGYGPQYPGGMPMNPPPGSMPAWPQQNPGQMPMGPQPGSPLGWGQSQPSPIPMGSNPGFQPGWGQQQPGPMPGGYPQMNTGGWGQQQPMAGLTGPKCPTLAVVFGIIYLLYAILSGGYLATTDFGVQEINASQIVDILAQVGIVIGSTIFGIGLLRGINLRAIKHAEIFGKVMFYLTLVAFLYFIVIYFSAGDKMPTKAKDLLFWFCVGITVQIVGWGCAAYFLGRGNIVHEYTVWVESKSTGQTPSENSNII